MGGPLKPDFGLSGDVQISQLCYPDRSGPLREQPREDRFAIDDTKTRKSGGKALSSGTAPLKPRPVLNGPPVLSRPRNLFGTHQGDPDNCLLWNIVSNWYEGQRCVYCHKRFGPLHHLDHVPALLGPDRKTAEWNQFQPEQLPKLFSTHWPVCWGCHVTQTFRREYPERVVYRGRDSGGQTHRREA
jgi:hypothetical protein